MSHVNLKDIIDEASFILYVSGYSTGLVLAQKPLQEPKSMQIVRNSNGVRANELSEYEIKFPNVPRLDYFYSGVLGLQDKTFCAPACPLLLLCGEQSNLVTNSNAFPDGSGWVVDGTKTFKYFGLTWIVGTAQLGTIKAQNVQLSDGITLSIHLKKTDLDEDLLSNITFIITDDLGTPHLATINWETGALVGNDILLDSYGTYDLGEGHYRAWVRFAGSNLTTVQEASVYYPEAEAIELAVSEIQIEQSETNSQIPTMPIFNNGASVPRLQETFFIPFVSDYFTEPNEGTFVMEFADLSRESLTGGSYGEGDQITLNDPSSSNKLVIDQSVNEIQYIDGNLNVLAQLPIQITNKVVFTWKGNVCQLWINDTKVDFIKSQSQTFNPTSFGVLTSGKYRIGLKSLIFTPDYVDLDRNPL